MIDVLQSEVKTESPSLKELLDLATTNSKEDTKPATTPLTPPHATSPASSDPVASSKSKKKEASPNTNKKSGGSQEGEGADEDHIAKLDIRVGIVRSVERHPDAESLYIEQVDVGDSLDSVQPASEANGVSSSSTRTIVSGLVKHIPKDYLEGRAVIVVRNMKPSKLRGVTSHGMLLCGMEKDSDGLVTKVELLEPAEGSQPGDKVLFEGFTDENTLPVPVLTPKRKWFEKTQVHFSVQDGIAFYKGSPFKTVRGLVRCRSINKGEIS
ncbi:hypothetical protein BGZ73_008619 [Actinomortierella ambigua]|nr:hypothetical protein BGZ73_008619 [Actinomortierella ambigua]